MIKHTQTIRRQRPMNCLSVFDRLVGLAFKGLTLKTLQLSTKNFPMSQQCFIPFTPENTREYEIY